MTLPLICSKFWVAMQLAGGPEVEFVHVYRACELCRPGNRAEANDLRDLFLEHLQAELEIGLHEADRPADQSHW